MSGAAKLKAKYDAMRPHYVGAAIDSSSHFDAELVESVINKMKIGKAAGLNSLTTEHLRYCNSIIPCLIAKLFNCMMAVGRVPTSFGQSYTVPILTRRMATANKTCVSGKN